jgi:hypothetical protein
LCFGGTTTMRTSIFLAITVGAVALAGGANAATYLLNQDACSSTCIVAPATSAGSITVTSIVGGLHIDVDLAANLFFNQAGRGHDALGFDLTASPAVTLQNIKDTHDGIAADEVATLQFGTPPISESSGGGFNAHSFGTNAGWDYGLDWHGVANNGSIFATGINEMSFDVIGSGLTLGSNGGAPPIFFTVDVARLNSDHVVVATGVVGATLVTGGVPEPASWALMILGFGGVGAVLRRRRIVPALA